MLIFTMHATTTSRYFIYFANITCSILFIQSFVEYIHSPFAASSLYFPDISFNIFPKYFAHISPNNIQVIQLRKVIWAGRVACMGEKKSMQRVFFW